MSTILSINTTTTEIVITERIVTSEYRIREIHENLVDRTVRVELELGPFTTNTFLNGVTELHGTGRRSIVVWQGDEYDAVRDSWTNADLIAKIQTLL
jgi:hypothetical protein